MNYEELLIEADKLGVIVKEFKLRTRDGRCHGNRIAINSSLSEKEKACVLSEELSHFRLTVGNISDQSNQNNRKQEFIARRDCYEKLITPECIIKALLSGANNMHELAEELTVTKSFLFDTINHYKKKYGIYYVGKTHLLTFEPLNIVNF
ncbi:MAG: ImmA/IrrE family metallo-endopeptidase [Clostridium sp.]|nr:ImmA/IrrE family metallo-endopeptidase [Clostridium sp.]